MAREVKAEPVRAVSCRSRMVGLLLLFVHFFLVLAPFGLVL